jgi:hypothetical protein
MMQSESILAWKTPIVRYVILVVLAHIIANGLNEPENLMIISLGIPSIGVSSHDSWCRQYCLTVKYFTYLYLQVRTCNLISCLLGGKDSINNGSFIKRKYLLTGIWNNNKNYFKNYKSLCKMDCTCCGAHVVR